MPQQPLQAQRIIHTDCYLDVERVDFDVHGWQREADCSSGRGDGWGLQVPGVEDHLVAEARGRECHVAQCACRTVAQGAVRRRMGWCTQGRWPLQAVRALGATMGCCQARVLHCNGQCVVMQMVVRYAASLGVVDAGVTCRCQMGGMAGLLAALP